jgi:hypothetical protein
MASSLMPRGLATEASHLPVAARASGKIDFFVILNEMQDLNPS